SINGTGTALDHRLVLEAIGLKTTSEPPARGDFTLQGRYADAAWQATVQASEIQAGTTQDEQLALVEPSKLFVSRERLQLEPLCFAMGHGRMCAEGVWQDRGAWEAIVSGYELPLAAFLPPAGPEAEFGGRIEGRVRLFGAPDT